MLVPLTTVWGLGTLASNFLERPQGNCGLCTPKLWRASEDSSKASISTHNADTSRRHITPSEQSLSHRATQIFRRRNKLMRAGRLEEADELTSRIGKEIKQRNKVRLNHVDGKSDAKTLWTARRS